MPVSDESTTRKNLCGKWMPRRQTNCARGVGHGGDCCSADYMENQRVYRRAQDRPYDPVAAQRWRSKHRLTRYGLTPEKFDQLMADQGYACEMCREPFGEALVHIDHDHTLGCHPGAKQACDKCRRGLLCLRCNTALGFIESRYEQARLYLEKWRGAA